MNISDRDFDTTRGDRGDRESTFDSESSFGGTTSGAGSTPGTGSAAAGGDTGSRSGESESGRDRGLGAAADAAGLPEADEIIDELLPEQVDWERLVRSYPLPALALAAAAGFYLAVSRGPVVVSAVTGWAAGEMTRRVNDLVGEDLL